MSAFTSEQVERIKETIRKRQDKILSAPDWNSERNHGILTGLGIAYDLIAWEEDFSPEAEARRGEE